MQLSLKPKTFSDFFIPFLESTSNFKDFEKNDDHHSYFVSEIADCKRLRLKLSIKNTASEQPLTVSMVKALNLL